MGGDHTQKIRSRFLLSRLALSFPLPAVLRCVAVSSVAVTIVVLLTAAMQRLAEGGLQAFIGTSPVVEYVNIKLANGAERRVALAPKGPMDEQFLAHHFQDVRYELTFDTETGYFNFENATMHDIINWSDRALAYRNAWIRRVEDFRQFLADEGKSNVDPNVDLRDAPYRMAEQPTTSQSETGDWNRKREYKVPDLHEVAEVEDARRFKRRFEFCQNHPHECGDYDHPVVVDMGLVLPLNVLRFNNSWPTLESLRQLVAFPREVVFVIGGTSYVENKQDIFSFLTILKEFYAPYLPDGVTMRAYMARELYRPGENRWFGFNQTTSPVVLTFDGDDYMHPQMFMLLNELFTKRPELDFALMQYEAGATEGEYYGDMYYKPIIRHLRMRHFTQEMIDQMTSYSDKEYERTRRALPTWGKTWWLGNTDAEPNWGGEDQRWWDYGCHNGWTIMRRHVLDIVTPPTDMFGGEDAIFNYRVARAGLNYRCLSEVLGVYVKCFCTGKQQLWAPSDLDPNVEHLGSSDKGEFKVQMQEVLPELAAENAAHVAEFVDAEEEN